MAILLALLAIGAANTDVAQSTAVTISTGVDDHLLSGASKATGLFLLSFRAHSTVVADAPPDAPSPPFPHLPTIPCRMGTPDGNAQRICARAHVSHLCQSGPNSCWRAFTW